MLPIGNLIQRHNTIFMMMIFRSIKAVSQKVVDGFFTWALDASLLRGGGAAPILRY